MIEKITLDQYLVNKEVIKVIERKDLLRGIVNNSILLKRNLLSRLGYSEICQHNGLIGVEVALPDAIHNALKVAYKIVIEENKEYERSQNIGEQLNLPF